MSSSNGNQDAVEHKASNDYFTKGSLPHNNYREENQEIYDEYLKL